VRFSWLLCVCAQLLAVSPALAEISAEIELKSDDRFRGRSLSDGRPVIEADVSIDSEMGIYAGGSVTAILTGESRAGLQGVDGYIGYATRIDDALALDIGVAGYAYERRYSGNRAAQYAEVYAGVTAGKFAAYLHFAPNYFDRDVSVLYADLNLAQPLGSDWTLKAHAGLLLQTSDPSGLGKKNRYDTRLAVSRPLLGLEAEVAWTYGGPDEAYFAGPWDGRSALVFSLSKHF
jgi:uncharacterized protein (TIGR02001 family)